MSMKAFNQLLGQSTIDPQVVDAFDSGRFQELLSRYDFQAELRQVLCNLDCQNFTEFAELGYQVVLDFGEAERSLPGLSPTDGLNENGIQEHEGQAA
jgi:hypothetical protein